MRALKIAGAAIAAVIAIVALLLVIGIPSGFMTSAIQARVERETGYRLTISGATRIGIWPSLNVTLNDIALQNPNDRDNSDRLTVGRVEADVTLESLWSGHPHITELTVDRPVAHVPLLRQRNPQSAPSAKAATSSAEDDANAPVIDHVTVSDGAIEFSNPHDRVDSRIEGINADAVIGGDRKIRVTGSAHASAHPLKFEIKATMPAPPLARQNIPVDLALNVPGVLQTPLSGKAEVRLNGSIVMINGLTGTLGDGAFNGWASVDIASKPLVKLDLDFQRLDVAASTASAASPAQPSQPWSNAPIDLKGLNYVDAQVRVSAAALNIGEAQFRTSRDRCNACRRRAEGQCFESRRLWRAGQWRPHRRCIGGRADLYAAQRPRQCPRVAAAQKRGRLRQARRQIAGEDRGALLRRESARHHVEPRTAPCSPISRTAPFAASMSRR